MAHYNVVYLSRQTLWFHAVNCSLEQLSRTNPGWTYSMMTEMPAADTPINLCLMDLTAEEDGDVALFPVTGSRMMVLVRATQRRLIKALQQKRCSILCVDEHYFNLREVIESSMRNKRFLSPFIRELTAQVPSAEHIVVLTEAENKVLNFIREGKNGVEISNAIVRSQKTVSSHKRNIMRKLGVCDDLSLKKKLLAMAESAN
ncbi:helix-turn-helix domain-containing protein [Scandinavium goeteborgense]|uniref:helix-turn-helix domain-containing protein n=1 Tax=Scandinavium goeteborgense TaxID=1851514 RepID=UPI000F65F3AC|nr:LuxR C-terminal-related transcriptional regulator [Scandinavium goeteborgense]QKN81664.1 response regulator transcription factor [Scandinavium goeteborgense]